MVRGQEAKRLSEHYLLECDYGTSILTVYNEGDPVFLCEGHVSAITPRDNCVAGVRPVEAKDQTVDQTIGHLETEAEQLALIVTAVAGANAEPSAAEGPVLASPDAPSAAIPEQTPKPGDSGAEACSKESEAEATEAPSAPAASGELASSATTIEVPVPAQAEEPAQRAEPEVARPNAVVADSGPVAAKLKREAAPVSRTPARDLTYGNAAKALVDETIWNMATGDVDAYRRTLAQGKTEMEAAQAAGGQFAVIHRKIAEYTAKIEPMLSASKASISVAFAIDKPLEQAVLEIIGSESMGDAEKDAAVAELGALQEQIKGGLQRDMAPLQAHRIAREIGERCRWGGDSGLPEELKHAYRAVYARLRDALRAFVPEAREIDERLANLYAAKSDLENAPGARAVRSAAL
jgi:hypothetical protein